MRLPWDKSKEVQLDLLDAEPGATTSPQPVSAGPRAVVSSRDAAATLPAAAMPIGSDGKPLLLAVSMFFEDAHNPRTEFPEESIAELAEDIQQRGVLQPLVVHPADNDGRHQVHFGAKRLRAAIRAGLHEVPVVVRDLPADRYAQVAENQKRSTYGNWVSERTTHSSEVAEMALAHAVCDKVEAAYRRGDLFEKRVGLMSEWAALLDVGAAAKSGRASVRGRVPRLVQQSPALRAQRDAALAVAICSALHQPGLLQRQQPQQQV